MDGCVGCCCWSRYDEILFMRQFVSFMITRLQLVTGLCPARVRRRRLREAQEGARPGWLTSGHHLSVYLLQSKEQEMVNNIVRSWWQRSMDYI